MNAAMEVKQPEVGFTPVTEGNRRFVWDGEPARPPKKGEWFLVPGIATAMQAPNDFMTRYFICIEMVESTAHASNVRQPERHPDQDRPA